MGNAHRGLINVLPYKEEDEVEKGRLIAVNPEHISLLDESNGITAITITSGTLILTRTTIKEIREKIRLLNW